jgi:hypothetical protein
MVKEKIGVLVVLIFSRSGIVLGWRGQWRARIQDYLIAIVQNI